MGDYGEFVPSPDGKKKVVTKIKESFSDWRTELKEVINTEDDEKIVKEKKVNNKVVVNPELKLRADLLNLKNSLKSILMKLSIVQLITLSLKVSMRMELRFLLMN